MAETQHTPGPWSTRKIWFGFEISGPNNEDIGSVNESDGLDWPTMYPVEANARLIAAAPDLFKALSRLANELEMPGERGVLRGIPEALKQARAALSKATTPPARREP